MSSFIRRKVSQNRIRLENDRYDLDLTYICENVIAMGLPADSFLQSVARNPLDTVARYLKEKHGGCYKIYNLLMKADYNYSEFDNMVESYPMPDHYPPNFIQIEDFCRNVHEWLLMKKENVAVVHCKAGKGRTGTMISAYFVYSKKYPKPFDAIEYFSSQRCFDGKGVTIPSQKRYVEYFADFLNKKETYREISIFLKQIDLQMPNSSFFNTLSFQLFKEHSIKIYDSESKKLSLKEENISWHLRYPIRLNGDINISFSNKTFRNKVNIFHATFNTYFLIEENFPIPTSEKSCLGVTKVVENNKIVWTLSKSDIDVAHKDKRFPVDMKLIFHFDRNASSSASCSNEKLNSSNNFNAFENLHITDDDGFYTKISSEIKKRTANSEVLSSNTIQHKPSISRSDSYVTPQSIVFDTSNDHTQNGSTNDTKEKNLLDRFNSKPKLETKKVLLTEQSHTSSEIENSESDISIKQIDIIPKQIIDSFKISSSSSAIGEEKLAKSETDGSLKEKSSKKVMSFFKKKNFFSLKKPSKLSSKYKRQRNSNSNNHNDTLEDQQSYDLLSSKNKISSTKVEENNELKLKETDDNDDYDEVYDDDEDIDDKENDLKKNNFKKSFFSRIKSN